MSKAGLFLTLGAAVISISAVSEKLKTIKYSISSDKVDSPVRLCLLSDLHSCSYGERQRELVSAVEAGSPNLVLMTGDMVDNRYTSIAPYRLFKELSKRFMCFFVSGNHEFYNGKDKIIKERIRKCGIRVLEGESYTAEAMGQKIELFGLDDAYIPIDNKGRLWEDQFDEAKQRPCDKYFSVLMTHRPELADLYSETSFDLTVAGHAHGGQVIIPKLINGLYSPNQGVFPKYAGGIFTLKNGGKMIVSRGLSKFNRPRVFNRPEVVFIDIVPKENN